MKERKLKKLENEFIEWVKKNDCRPLTSQETEYWFIMRLMGEKITPGELLDSLYKLEEMGYMEQIGPKIPRHPVV